MAIPAEFSETELLQNLVRKLVNKEIREDFKDLGDETWEPDVTTTRGAMRHALTHKDNDPITHTLLRLFLYYFTYGAAKALQADIFGTIASNVDAERRYRPQINLFFSQKKSEVEEGENRVEGEISFRLMDETPTTITQAKVNALALEIKNTFATPNKLVWSKGRLLVAYVDKPKGYQLQLLVNTKAEAKDLITKVLSINDDTPDWTKMTSPENEDAVSAYPANPGNQTILGKVYKKPHRRPVVKVEFRYATLAIQGRKKKINLVDTTGYKRNAIETTY